MPAPIPHDWTQFEVALLIALRSRSKPVPYQQICDDYIPNLTTSALRGKVSWVIDYYPELCDEDSKTLRQDKVIAWIKTRELKESEIEELLRHSMLLT